jgi:hypothetical protein
MLLAARLRNQHPAQRANGLLLVVRLSSERAYKLCARTAALQRPALRHRRSRGLSPALSAGSDDRSAEPSACNPLLRNRWTGQGFLCSPRGCVTPGSLAFGHGNNFFGVKLKSGWSSGHDDAIVRNDDRAHWTQGPWVDMNPSNGSYVSVNGWTDSPVGTWICTSGITTRSDLRRGDRSVTPFRR